jgi:hypothetical protein
MNATFLSPLVGAIPVPAELTATIPATVFPAGSGNMENPALLSAGDDPNLLNRPRSLDIEAFRMGIDQEPISTRAGTDRDRRRSVAISGNRNSGLFAMSVMTIGAEGPAFNDQ